MKKKKTYWNKLLREFQNIVGEIEDASSAMWWKIIKDRGEIIEKIKKQCFPDTEAYEKIRECPAFMFAEITPKLMADKNHPVTRHITRPEKELFPTDNVCQMFVLITSNPNARLGREVVCKTDLIRATINKFDSIPSIDPIKRSEAIAYAKRWIRFIKKTIKDGLSNPNIKGGRPLADEKHINCYLHSELVIYSRGDLMRLFKYSTRGSLSRAIKSGKKRFESLSKREKENVIEKFCEQFGQETSVFSDLL